jgi:hypothetical protein
MFKELYYWMYMTLRKIKTNDTPAFNSYILICLLQGFNIGTVYVITTYLINIRTTADRNTAIYMGLGLAAVLFVTNYFLLYAQRESIFEKYKNITQKRKIKGQFYFWLYVVLSLVIFFTAGINLVTPEY